jgi:hypothetical protein
LNGSGKKCGENLYRSFIGISGCAVVQSMPS